jgi:hypothetical protein
MKVNMSKYTDSSPALQSSADHCNTETVVRRVAETVIAGILILMMAACNVGPNYKRTAVFHDPVLQPLVTDALGGGWQ